MGNTFGSSSSSTPAATPTSNFVASGHGVYLNSNGETIHDSFRHVNGEFTRETSTSNSQMPNALLQPQYPGGQMSPFMVPAIASVMMVLFVALFIYSRQRKRSVRRTVIATEDVERVTPAIPLYSLNNKPRHASEAMWNIDLLDDE